MSGRTSRLASLRSCPDAGPCDAVDAVFTFGAHRCGRDAYVEVRVSNGFGDEWFRCCPEHLADQPNP